MKAITVLMALTLGFVGAVAHAADNPHLGSWKLNESKSQIAPGTGKNTSVVYTMAADKVKVTVEGVDKDGKPVHNEWVGKFDGKDYPVTGDSIADMRSYTMVDDRTMTFSNKKDGKETLNGRIVLSADGKSRTVTVKTTNEKGEKVALTSEYDKQ